MSGLHFEITPKVKGECYSLMVANLRKHFLCCLNSMFEQKSFFGTNSSSLPNFCLLLDITDQLNPVFCLCQIMHFLDSSDQNVRDKVERYGS